MSFVLIKSCLSSSFIQITFVSYSYHSKPVLFKKPQPLFVALMALHKFMNISPNAIVFLPTTSPSGTISPKRFFSFPRRSISPGKSRSVSPSKFRIPLPSSLISKHAVVKTPIWSPQTRPRNNHNHHQHHNNNNSHVTRVPSSSSSVAASTVSNRSSIASSCSSSSSFSSSSSSPSSSSPAKSPMKPPRANSYASYHKFNANLDAESDYVGVNRISAEGILKRRKVLNNHYNY